MAKSRIIGKIGAYVMEQILCIRNLCKQYPSFRLQSVSFAVEKEMIMGFIGRNGAGKTTTLKSIMNLVHPDSGEIRFFGMEPGEKEHNGQLIASQRMGDFVERYRLAAVPGELTPAPISYIFLAFGLMNMIQGIAMVKADAMLNLMDEMRQAMKEQE